MNENTINTIRESIITPFIQRIVIIVCIILLVGCLCWVSYAFGGVKSCASTNGFLDSSFICHPNSDGTYRINITTINGYIIPNDIFIINNSFDNDNVMVIENDKSN